jgi:hypothetical protein
MTDPQTIRVSDPAELLALIPHQLGFQPHESAVAVSLRGPRGQVGMIARVDLDGFADPESGPQLARQMMSHLVSDGAHRVFLALYTDDPRGALSTLTAANIRDAALPFFDDEVKVWAVQRGGGAHRASRTGRDDQRLARRGPMGRSPQRRPVHHVALAPGRFGHLASSTRCTGDHRGHGRATHRRAP